MPARRAGIIVPFITAWVSLLETIDAIVVYKFITLAAGRREPRPVPITLQEVSKFTVHGSANGNLEKETYRYRNPRHS